MSPSGTNLASLTLEQGRDGLRAGEFTSVELTRACQCSNTPPQF